MRFEAKFRSSATAGRAQAVSVAGFAVPALAPAAAEVSRCRLRGGCTPAWAPRADGGDEGRYPLTGPGIPRLASSSGLGVRPSVSSPLSALASTTESSRIPASRTISPTAWSRSADD